MDKKKGKYVEVAVTFFHLADLEKSLSRGVLNGTEPLWLAAFAAYNTHHKNLRLSVEFESSYRAVLDWLKTKLK